MEFIGNLVIYMIMASALIGAIFSLIDDNNEIGRQFLEGINSIGSIFLPVAGIMASAPYITHFVTTVFAPMFSLVGADPAMAATTFIAVDMGGYQLAQELAHTNEGWIMAMTAGYMAGATIVFSIPVALKMLKPADRRFLALGTMYGFITIPVGVLVSSLIIFITEPSIRSSISTSGSADITIIFSLKEIIFNLTPLCLICFSIAFGLYYSPEKMIKGFTILGKVLDISLRLVFIFCVIEYFTGMFTKLFGSWGFDPIIADENDINRALEVSGYIGIMLCGAFPMVYIIRTYCKKPLQWLGHKFGLSSELTAALLACSANVLALFAMLNTLTAKDKIKAISFSVCSAFLVGDHLAFTANFQPSLIIAIITGKLFAGCLAIYLSGKLLSDKIIEGRSTSHQ